MPNWVFNTISVSGSYKNVLEVKQVMSQPIPVMKMKPGSAWEAVQGAWDMAEVDFSFWNVVAPPVNKWVEYFTGENWYNWNIANWGCKWDAKADYETGNALEGEYLNEEYPRNELVYRIETAWSPPIAFIEKMAERFPMCQIELAYEEEQGWGGELIYDAGQIVSDSEYDVPLTHSDYMERGRDCNFCEWGEPAPDCPGYIPIEHVKPVELTAEELLARLKADGEETASE